MGKTVWKPAMAALVFCCPARWAAAAVDSSMPQLTLPNAVLEDPDETPVVTASVTAASNYIFRGVSQTENNPAVFGSTRLTLDGFYAGVGAENVDFHNSIDAEYDLSAGWTPSVAGFNLDLGVVRYGYIDEPIHTHIDTVEIKAIASHAFGPATLGAAVFYTPYYFGTGRDGTYFEGRAGYKITESLTASGAIGRQTIGVGGDFTTWNAGLGYAVTKNLGVDLHYYDSDDRGAGKRGGGHIVGAVKASF
jgi:uncharacterized protein (TIGR02001 family)